MPSCLMKWLVGLRHEREQVGFLPRSLSPSQNSPSAPTHFPESKMMYLWPPAPESATGFPTPLEGGFPALAFWRLEDRLGAVENGRKSFANPERGGWAHGKLLLTSGLPPAAFFLCSPWLALFHPLGHNLKVTSSGRPCLNTPSDIALVAFENRWISWQLINHNVTKRKTTGHYMALKWCDK